MPAPNADDPLEQFLRELWADFDEGRVRALDDYLARYPACAGGVREEWEAASRGSPQTSALRPGSRVGRYRVERELQAGGMGRLWLAHDPELGRSVVLKTLRAPSALEPQALERLEREARIGGRLAHPHVCPVLDVVHARDHVFVVMPFFEGVTLADWIARTAARRTAAGAPPAAGGPLAAWTEHGELAPVLALLEKVARAVHAAHEGGVIHRDLKPQNILVRTDGEPVVLDFGLALETESEEATRLTQEGDLLGTPHYMAPEQAEGRPLALDARTDVYALGAVLYEALALVPPFTGRTRREVIDGVLRGDPAPPRRRDARVPRDLEAVCLKALSREPKDRYASALDLADDLRRVRTLEATIAKPLSVASRLLRRLRRRPRETVLLLACITVTVGGGISWLASRRAAQQAAVVGAALRIVDHGRAGAPPARADLDALRPLFADDRGMTLFVEALTDADPQKTLDALVRTARDLYRGGDDEARERLLRPRGKVADLTPAFRFEAPKLAAAQSAFRLALETPDRPPLEWGARSPGGEAREVAAELPAGVALEPGREYRWRVTLDPAVHGELTGYWQPAAAHFEVVVPQRRDELRAVPPSGEPVFDRLIAAARLLAAGLATDALDELTAAPGDGGAWGPAQALLAARVHAALGDERGVAAARVSLAAHLRDPPRQPK